MMMDALWRNLRFAMRLLRTAPAFTAVAILSLALGTGANTAIFQLFDAIRLRTLPVKAPRELAEVRIDDMTEARGNWLRDNAMTNPLWERIRDRQESFSGVFAWASDSFNIAQSGEDRDIGALWVSGDFFRVLGVAPAAGRLFTPADDRRGCGLSPGAVISYGFWQREFAGDRSIIGRTVAIGAHHVQIIGVTPPEFYGLEVGRTFAIALPICSESAWDGGAGRLDSGTTWWLTVMGRLKPGVGLQQATARFQSISKNIFADALPPDYPQMSVKAYLAMKLLTIPAGGGISRLRDQYSTSLIVLMGIAGFVLLIACANLANLMLARGSARRREVAVRLAMGASRGNLLGQLITEGLLLAAAGATLGLLIGRTLSRVLIASLASDDGYTFVNLALDWPVFLFTAGLCVATCLLFALGPALRMTKGDAAEALKSGGRSASAGREGAALRRVLAASQIALSLALLVGAVLFAETFRNLLKIEPGFDRRGVVIVDVHGGDFASGPGRAVSYRGELLEKLRAIPGIESAAEVTIVPLVGYAWNNRMWKDGSDSIHARVVLRSMIGAGYFHAMKTSLVAGRDFTGHDLASFSRVAIVNREFARQVFGDQNPVGRRFWVESTPTEPQTDFEIVGVAENTLYRDLREEIQPIAFTPLSKAADERSAARFLLRSTMPDAASISSARAALNAINPNLRYNFTVLDSWIGESLLRERLIAALSGAFGALALLLTTVGLYGVISYTVARRTSEIGIRIALGARRANVIALVMRETGIVLAVGLAAGGVLAFAVGRASAALLYGLKPGDPFAFLAAAAALAIIAGAATYLPASRATRVNPVTALREE